MLEGDEIDAGAAEHVDGRVGVRVAGTIEDDDDAMRAGRDVAGQARGAAAERRAGAAYRHDHVESCAAVWRADGGAARGDELGVAGHDLFGRPVGADAPAVESEIDRRQLARISCGACETSSTVAPRSRNSCSRWSHLATKPASPTASTSSRIRRSGTQAVAIEKPRRASMPDE